MIAPAVLARRLGELRLEIERVGVEVRSVRLDAYPGGERPSGIVTLAGRGVQGRGELVGWSLGEQHRLAEGLRREIGPVQGAVCEVASRIDEPFSRAALEGALIDLALRQNHLSFADLCGVPSGPCRYVLSFAAVPNPAARIAELLGRVGDARFKVDVDPVWSDAVIEALALTDRVDVLDFKERGTPSLVRRLHEAMPTAILEDPPVLDPREFVARDRSVKTPKDARGGHWVNVKAPRLGGYLAALETLERAPRAYMGGMFEVGPGRAQARVLAALYSPAGPNDVAPLVGRVRASPLDVRFDRPGFG